MKKSLIFSIIILLITFNMVYAQEKLVGITTKVVNPTGELGNPHKSPDTQIGEDETTQSIEVPNTNGVTIYYNYINHGTELEVTFRGDWYGHYDNEYSGTVVIPEEVTIGERTLKVTSIGNSAFSGCHTLTAIIIPNSVTSIGKYAFSECHNLDSVTIPNNITSIGAWAFHNCKSLGSVTIPESLTSIEDYTFDSCFGLTSITIPNSVTAIGVSAFAYSSLTSATIPNSVTSIGDYTFAGCSSMTSVSIPNSVTAIGDYVFAGCRSLASVTIPDNVTSIGDDAFYKCYGLVSVTIGNSVTSIGKEAFYECTSLDSVTIGNSVTSIGEWAFAYCTNLSSITIPNSLTIIENNAFYNCGHLIAIHITDLEAFCKIQFDGDFYSYHHLYFNGKIKRSLTIPEGVTSIGNYAFSKCLGLQSITIPNSVTSIGYLAFAFCPDLKDIYCYAEQVPETDIDTFIYSNYENATLHVPAAFVDEYSNTMPWRNFDNIVALTNCMHKPSGVFSPTATQHPTIKNYDLNGRRTSLPQRGIYIIKMSSNGSTRKVIVK